VRSASSNRGAASVFLFRAIAAAARDPLREPEATEEEGLLRELFPSPLFPLFYGCDVWCGLLSNQNLVCFRFGFGSSLVSRRWRICNLFASRPRKIKFGNGIIRE
jgi:hypothetical protein